jgi:endoglucanase
MSSAGIRGCVLAVSLALGMSASSSASARTVGAASASRATRRASLALLSGIRVSGRQLVNGRGAPIQLRGVNRSGTEYACVQGWGIFDGPSNAASVRAIASWHVNVVRIPLNEDCWLGINGIKPAYSGVKYRNAILAYVKLLHRYGMYAELSLIWGAPGSYQAAYQPNAPDENHAPAMWASMATTFRHDPDVILSPWGETTLGWSCFMQMECNDQGSFGPGNVQYRSAPMQQAVNRMRGVGYQGVIAIPCLYYANSCGTLPDGSLYRGSTWLRSRPSDPAHQLIAEAHIYGKNLCASAACFDASLAPITNVAPLIFGETGETYDASDCGSHYIATFMNWADRHGVGYETWTWDTWKTCGALIKNYNGTPYSDYGKFVQKHYAQRAGVG